MKFPDLSRGLCREIGVELFYPEEKGSGSETYVMARKICASCVVRVQCLEWAIRHEDHGMWGGTSPVERRQLRRQKNIILQDIYVKEFV